MTLKSCCLLFFVAYDGQTDLPGAKRESSRCCQHSKMTQPKSQKDYQEYAMILYNILRIFLVYRQNDTDDSV